MFKFIQIPCKKKNQVCFENMLPIQNEINLFYKDILFGTATYSYIYIHTHNYI